MKRGRKQPSVAGKQDLTERAALSMEALSTRLASSRIIFTHPDCRWWTLLLAEVIQNPPCDLFYYDLGAEDVSLQQFLTGLTYSLGRQMDAFGGKTREALSSNTTSIAALAEAFALDLDKHITTPYLLILDEFDRADAFPEVQEFLDQVLDLVPDRCHILVSSRTLPSLLWRKWAASGQALILRDSGAVPDGFYSATAGEGPTLEAHALGPGYVLLDGKLVETWQGRTQQLMFFFALDRPKFTRNEICRAMWPELSEAQVVNVFHVTKRRLHGAFGFDVLVFDGLHYQINPQLKLHYDIVDFVRSLVMARDASGDEAIGHWQRAIELYQGHYLQGYPESWVASRREDFREGYIEALQGLAHIRMTQGQDEHALGLLLRALSEAYGREELHIQVFQLYARLGQPDQAEAHYAQLVRDFKEQYNTEPSPDVQAAFQEAVGQR